MNRICKFVLIFFIFFSVSVFSEPRIDKKQTYKELERFTEALSIVQQSYVDIVPLKKIIDGAIKGMVQNLDPSSEFMDQKQYRDLQIQSKGEYGGLGMSIGIRDEILTVIAPMPDTPASRAGIKSGDRIVRIEGESTKGIQAGDAVDKLRGKPGTQIKIVIWRKKDKKLQELTLTREKIEIKPVQEEKIIKEDIGHIWLVQFNEHTAGALDKSLENLKNKGMKRLILDLRNNPGGLLTSAIAVSERFLKEDDIIVSLSGKSELGATKAIKSSGKHATTDIPLLVLVNGGSASASEIVAGAIRDNKRGLIVGLKTYGKGSVQTVIPLKDNYALRLTTSRYYTPGGHRIDKGGITPDIIIEEKPPFEVAKEKTAEQIFEDIENDKVKEDETLEKEDVKFYDYQLEQAVFLLKGFKFYEQIKK